MRYILGVLFATSAFAQTAVFPGAVAGDAQMAVAVNQVQTILRTSIGSSDTSATVVSSTGFVVNSIASISGPGNSGSSEEVWVCSVVGNVLSFGRASCPNIDGRGIDSTNIVAHNAGAQVTAYVDAWHHNSEKVEITALENAAANEVSDIAYAASTFAAACSYAAGLRPRRRLVISLVWSAVPTQACAADLRFVPGGKLVFAASAAFTPSGSITAAPSQQIFDISASGSSVVAGGPAAMLNPVFPAWFGAAVDGTTDEITYDQAAVNFFGSTATMRSGQLNMCGPHLISTTLLFENKSIVVSGCGWGSSSATPKGSYIKYGGTSTAVPLVKVKGSEGFVLQDIRLIGDSSHKPTAAIDYAAGNGIGTSSNLFRNIRIGSFVGLDSDDNEQFQNGILSTGANANVDLTQWDKIYIYKAPTCINIANTQNVNWTFTNLTTVLCSTAGLTTNAPVTLISPSFNNNAVDFTCAAGSGGRIRGFNYISEGAGRMAVMTNSGGACIVHMTGGVFNIGSALNADGKVIVANDNSFDSIVLDEFEFFDDLSESHAPVFDFTHSSGGYLRYVDIGISKGTTITHSNFLISSIVGASTGDYYNFQSPVEAWRILTSTGWNNDSSFTPQGNEFRANILQLKSFTFATLPSWAQLRDGTIVYCSDCTIATPTNNGGTGALVVRENGAWSGK